MLHTLGDHAVLLSTVDSTLDALAQCDVTRRAVPRQWRIEQVALLRASTDDLDNWELGDCADDGAVPYKEEFEL